MKKLFLIFFLFFGCCGKVWADDKIAVDFSRCIDGDTAEFILKKEKITTRFLAVDTPETKHPTKGNEPFGNEASEFTCNKLKTANNIFIEYDLGSNKLDNYGRHLVWVWADDYLLQDELIKQGLAEVAYLYGNYKYTGLLQDHEVEAKLAKKGKWADVTEVNYWLYIGGIITTGILALLYYTGKMKKKDYNKGIKLAKKYGKL